MVVTGRAVALAALGAIAVVLRPDGSTVVAWLLAVVALCVLDVLLAVPTPRLTVRRAVPDAVRLDEHATCTVTLTNESRRAARGRLRRSPSWTRHQ